MYVDIASASASPPPPPPYILQNMERWRCMFGRSPYNPYQQTEKRGTETTGGPPESPMARRSRPRLRPTLVVYVNNEGSVYDKDGY